MCYDVAGYDASYYASSVWVEEGVESADGVSEYATDALYGASAGNYVPESADSC